MIAACQSFGESKPKSCRHSAARARQSRFARHCERSEAIHLTEESMDCFVARAPRTDAKPTCASVLAARSARAVDLFSAPNEGVGNAGCPLHPRPRVQLQ